ncbi:MAG: ABC transporter permease [Opitutaceae bacterium]|nr:ABC transporter permease [Opitutaceae bacterium]
MFLLRHAIRQLMHTPSVSTIAVASLALGIGVNAIVFSWIESILLRPLPGVRDGDAIVAVLQTQGARPVGHCISPPDIADYGELTDIFAGVVGSQVTPACLTVEQQQVWLYGQIATPNFFDVLGVHALPGYGRTFLPADGDKPGGNPVLVLSERCWRQHFGAAPEIIGRAVEINRHPFTVIGVVPGAFRGTMSGLVADFWAPVTMHREIANFGSLDQRTDRWLHTQARLQSGVSLERARAAIALRAEQVADTYPGNRDIGATVVLLRDAPYGGQAVFMPVLRVLAVVGLVVLLLVVANVANLLLARATARQRDTAVRLAVGAGRRHILTQWFAESLLLALAGGALGVLLSTWGTSLFGHLMPETPLPTGYDFTPSGRVLVAVAALTLVAGLGFGLVPALHAARANVQEVLKQGGRSGGAGSSSARMRGVLVVTEVALALALLVGAVLCIRGTQRAREIDAGLDPRQVLVSGLRIGMNGYDEPRALSFYRELRERLAAAPGVEVAAMASWLPLGFEGGPSIGTQIEGYTPAPGENMSVPYAIVSPDYFATMRIPLRAGRDFTDRDDSRSAPVMIVNQAAADKYWPGQSPLGRKVRTWRGTAEVVGVVATGKYRGLDEPPMPFVFLPYQQGAWDLNLGPVVRAASGDPRALLSTVRAELQGLDPGVALWSALPMEHYIAAAYLRHHIATLLLSALGAVALVLAAMGIYGVMAYHVSQRVPEIGVRMALGAQPRDILAMVLGTTLRLLAPGLVVGGLIAWWAGHGLAHALPGVSTHDGVAFLSVALLLASIALLACWLPARRATKVDPLTALRAE